MAIAPRRNIMYSYRNIIISATAETDRDLDASSTLNGEEYREHRPSFASCRIHQHQRPASIVRHLQYCLASSSETRSVFCYSLASRRWIQPSAFLPVIISPRATHITHRRSGSEPSHDIRCRIVVVGRSHAGVSNDISSCIVASRGSFASSQIRQPHQPAPDPCYCG